jgi:DNA-directed RNA polymerase subunit L/DNA-directed RNA polymerase alpha subunit
MQPGSSTMAASVFQNIQGAGGKIRFRLTPTKFPYANTLRRVILAEVESVGFRADILNDGSTSDVKITKNTTPISNEMLAHRIGLLPVSVSTPLNWRASDYEFRLAVKNESANLQYITASDIEVFNITGDEPVKVPNTQFFVPDPISRATPLIAVLKGKIGQQEPEEIAFTARATIGIGRENARFIPVSQCSYKYTLDEDTEKQKQYFIKWLQDYKKVEFSQIKDDEPRRQAFEREFKTMEISRCYLQDSDGEPVSFDFEIETVGPLSPLYCVARALDVLQEKLVKYASIDSGSLPTNVRVRPSAKKMKGFDFVFEGEDHTLGNLLQSWMEATQVDTGLITYVGYAIPHPLKDEMLISVGVEDGAETTARAAIAQAARETAAMFRSWAGSWAAATGAMGSAGATGSARFSS